MAQPISEFRPRPASPAGRVPPHNLQAEESLLGAMLLSSDAIAVAAETGLGPDDFYKPAHGHVYDAITTLYGRGQPCDPVTVAEELQRAGLLDAIGGPALLIALQARTPATSSAAHYARIVDEHALMRRLIGAANEIAEIGYSLPSDIGQAVNDAEQRVYDVAQRRLTDSMEQMKDLIGPTLDRLEALYDQGAAVTGLPTGYTDLDERLAGLQPSNLVIVGGRPGMGKALALDTPVPTPSGWTTMGAIEVGDVLIDERGQPCTVTYATPVQYNRSCYEVAFDDGSTIVADADHQWFAYDLAAWKSLRARAYLEAANASRMVPRNTRLARDQSARRKWPRVVTTKTLAAEGVRRGGRPNWYVPLTRPLELPEADLAVDPYVLGCWLGDGCSTSSQMTLGECDAAHFQREFELAGYGLEWRHDVQWATVPIRGQGAWQAYAGPKRVLTRELDAVGLLRGVTRHIPDVYLRGSAKQRLALLQGLLDTDGGVTNANGTVELVLADRELLAQAREIACSLGHKPGPIRRKDVKLGDGRTATAWRLRWTPLDPPFRLGRKAAAFDAGRSRRQFGRLSRRAVVSVTPVRSVPVRCITVDSPSHLYLAGESMVPTHNTSMALGMAAHAAMKAHTPVLFFSLEMSHLELTQRLLGSAARVDGTRLRTGKLHENDWPKIVKAAGDLADAPLFIDDNPHLTVMEIRAKARRMRSKLGGLGLIVIDYLQLMTGGGRQVENRQVEVSEISRGLKILARELNVPVVALSQLSRNLEMRADKRPQLADLRESGCLTADTRVLRADTGAEVTMGELLLTGERDIPVWSLDAELRMVPATMTHVFPSGIKQVFALRLASGRSVKASANHPFLTVDGWRRLDELVVGDRIAIPRRTPAPLATTSWPEIADALSSVVPNTNVDTLYGHAPSRPRLGRVAAVLDDDNLRRLSTSDVFWDQVVALEPRGEEPVYDASVVGTHNFVANGIAVHNSIEQDSDVVLFVYRDEVYNRETSDDHGGAEVIIAKHRNGPVGTVRLAFLERYALFFDMARGV